MNAKLTEAQVKKIRAMKGKLPATAIATRFSIRPTTVYAIWDWRIWQSV